MTWPRGHCVNLSPRGQLDPQGIGSGDPTLPAAHHLTASCSYAKGLPAWDSFWAPHPSAPPAPHLNLYP